MRKLSAFYKLVVRACLFLLALLLFIFALLLMKESAGPLAPVIRGTFSVDSAASALGLGWLTASLALSGSPVAASALSLLDANVLNPHEGFAMISGSRLGASMVVLIVGFTYMLRGKDRNVSLGVGLTSLLVTQTLYPVVLVIGSLLLRIPLFLNISFGFNQGFHSPLSALFDPIVNYLTIHLHPGLLLLAGFLLTIFSLWLFDRVIPELDLKDSNVGQISQLVYRPMVTFLLGAVITSMTMSVSVSLSLLVPLSVRGFVRTENIIPYILGANITTFIDTLIAAFLLANPVGITVVLIMILSVLVSSLFILVFGYRNYERFIQRAALKIGSRKYFLIAYLLIIFSLPFLLMWIG
jgi:hypothetical protein